MKFKKLHRAAFTLVEIMIVVAIIGMLAAIAIPNFVKARNTAQANACINNMRQMDSAIQQWALETGQQNTAVANDAVVGPYIKGGEVPKCPAGAAVYQYAADISISPAVTCPNAGNTPPHVLK